MSSQNNSLLIKLPRVTITVLVPSLLLLLAFVFLHRSAYAGWSDPILITPDNEKTQVVNLGDMNGDGALDIVAGNYKVFVNDPEEPSVIYLNTGEGSFTRGTEITGLAQALGDINGDGTLDVVASDGDKMTISLNDGTGNIYQRTEIIGPNLFGVLAIGDIDGNGGLDIVSGEWEQKIALYLNDGRGNFTKSNSTTTAYQTHKVVLGDLDGKNGLDIVAMNFYTYTDRITVELPDGGTYSYERPLFYVNIYLNDGTGSFSAAGTLDSPVSTRDIALGDVNGDGAFDIVVSNLDYLDTLYDDHSKVYLNKNDGTGSFLAGNPLERLDFVTSVTLGDVNSDGAVDIIVSNTSEPSVVVYLNSGTGSFDEGTALDSAFSTASVKQYLRQLSRVDAA